MTVRGCGQDDCDTTLIEPVDLFCRSHNALILIGNANQWVRNAIGIGFCAAIWIGFFASPYLNNIVPLFLVLIVLGGLTVWLPVRLFPVAGPSVAIGWVIACLLAPLLTTSDIDTFRITSTIVAIAISLAWIARLARAAFGLNRSAGSRGGTPGAALTASILGVAATTLILAVASTSALITPLVDLPAAISSALFVLGAWAIGTALVCASGFAAVISSAGWRDAQSLPLPSPRRPARLRRPAPVANRPTPGRRGAAPDLGRFVDQFSHVVTILVLFIGDILIYLCYYWALKVLVAIANWILLWVIACALVVVRSGRLLARSSWTAARVIVVPAVGMLVAASFLLSFAYADVHYARSGGISDLGLLFAYGIGAYAILIVSWLALCALPLARTWPAVIDMVGASAAVAIILVLVGGWGMGLLGAFGYGPFSVGWLTIGSTTCVVALWAVRAFRRRTTSSFVPSPPPHANAK